MNGDDVVPGFEQRLVDGEEVAHGGLRRRRQVGRRAQVLVVVVEVREIDLAVVAALPVDVEADLVDLVRRHEVRREIVRRVRDDRDLGHAAAS
jgi:hypothetical protein